MKYGGRSALKLLTTAGLGCLVCICSTPGLRAQGVLTWHNDAARTGQNLEETLLSPANVNSTNFGLLFNLALDGKVDAQPLYVPAVSIAGGTHNVLYVVTENDTVYAFDADSGTELWTPKSMIPSGETVSNSDNSCGQIGPEVGITSTPAIDLTQGTNGTIYLVAMTQNGSSYYHRLHALDLVSGNEQSGWPITITASTFVPKQYKERAGLLISNGVIYTTWASNCDSTPYNSWIMGYNESTRAQVVLNMTPNGSQGGIWMANAGPAADAGGNVYFLIGNGTFDTTLNANGFPDEGDYGNAFMNISTTNGLTVADYFTMDNTVSESGSDEDLGSGGAMLLPVLNDAMSNPHELAVGAGKDGNAYVVDRNNMGKYNGGSNAVYQEFALGGGVFSSPAWFNNTLYYGPNGPQLSAYPYSEGLFGSGSPGTPSSQSSASFGSGTTPSISANGTTNGIVWAVNNGSPAVLYAYNAANLGTELYDSNQASGNRDHFGATKFVTPTVANGKVFVGTTTGVAIFGIMNCTYSVPGTLPISSAGASGEIEIPTTPTTGCPFSATTTAEFIALSPVANGQVPYVISANPGAARVGTILIAGHVLTITQAGSDTLVPAPSNPSPANGSSGVSISPTLTWSASTGATSYDVYFGTSSTPSLVTNTTSTSYAPGTLSAGISYYWMVVAKNSAGTNPSPVWSFVTTAATATSITPSAGSGATQNFVLQFSDTSGADSLVSVAVSFNPTIAGNAPNSCVLSYTIASNEITLLNNAGSPLTPVIPGTVTTLQNSQCSLNVATTTATQNGKVLTLNLPMSFPVAYDGGQMVNMYAGDISGTNSGWQQMGTWSVVQIRSDFNNDGHPDVVFQSPSTGAATVYFLDGAQGTTLLGSSPITTGNSWHIAAVADFNGDGHPDLVWQDPVTGESQIWFMGGADGTTFLSSVLLTESNTWRIAAAADFNLDGHPDLVWLDPVSGHAQVWYLAGSQGASLMGAANLTLTNTWHIVGAMDFNQDGHPDVVWQDPVSGDSQIWYLGGSQGNIVTAAAQLTTQESWDIVAVADFNLDGHPDIVWQNPMTGASQVWLLNGAQGTNILGTSALSSSISLNIVAPR
jgi:hypothetical protein